MITLVRKLKELWDSLYQYRFYLLLTALILMIVLPAFISEEREGLIWTLNRTLVQIACINLLRRWNRGLTAMIVLAILSIGFDWVTVSEVWTKFNSLVSLGLYGLFVGLISYQVFYQVLKTKEVDNHMIVGAFCGYTLIGLIAFIFCSFLHILNPESFSNVAPGPAGIGDLLYFSYITVLTIGYGDIAPLTEEAQRISIFFGLIGQFYLAVILAVLVSKFSSRPA